MLLRKIYFIWISRDKMEFEWFRLLLEEIYTQIPRSFLEIKIFLTEKLSIDEVYNISIRSQDELDPITESKILCYYGRPNWFLLFKEFGSIFNGTLARQRVGVFYCGPKSLAEELNVLCTKNSNDMLKFVFRKEND